MTKLILIRHGKTYGNTLAKYIGSRTDESLCEEGVCLLKEKEYPDAERIYASPMKRCRETADLLYPKVKRTEVPSFRECDFGIFENKNYQELSDHPAYQAWIDSNGTLPFPEGESMEEFRERCCKGFEACMENILKNKFQQVALVVHGGTIMSIMSRYGLPVRDYFSWQLKNGEYYELSVEKELWEKERKIRFERKG